MSDPPLRDAVDEVLDAAWPRERRRALARMAASTLGRVAVFVAALLLLGLAVFLAFHLVVPWVFYAFMTGLVLVCARPEAAERAHLDRKDPGTPRPGARHRPSTGCYPRNGLLSVAEPEGPDCQRR